MADVTEDRRQVSRWRRAITAGIAGLLAATCAVVSSPAAGAATLSESEPNDTQSQADLLPLGDTMTGTAYRSGPSYDRDYYAIDIPANGRFRPLLTFPKDLGVDRAYEFIVYDSAGAVRYRYWVDGGDWSGAWANDYSMYLPAGRAYIQIYGSSSYASWGKTYTLKVTNTAGFVETETNDTTSTADVLPVGKTISASTLRGTSSYDRDYYAVDIPANGRFRPLLTFPKNLGVDRAYEFIVYDSAGAVRYRYWVDGSDWSGAWANDYSMYLPKGRAYIQIYGASSYASWGKTYTLKVTNTAGFVETEVNDSTSTADVLPINKAISASSLRGTSSYDRDYYAVDVSGSGPIFPILTFPKGLGVDRTYYLAVYNSSGTRLFERYLKGNEWSGSWVNSQRIVVPKGRAYIQIYGASSYASWGKTYKLTVLRGLTATPTPTIPAAAGIGTTVKVKPGTWSPAPVTLSYQWLRNGAAITGATKSSYKLVAADRGKKISVKVTGKRTGFKAVAKTSKALVAGTLTATPVPTIAGTRTAGSTLTVKPGTWKPAPVALSYRWLRNGAPITSAVKSTYKLVAADKGKKISVRVTAKKTGFTTVTKVSKVTAAIK